MTLRWLVGLAVLLVPAGLAQAQPAKPPEPTIELRLRSANELIAKAEYLVGLSGQDDLVKQLRNAIKQITTDGKGLEGIDPTQPFGLYATLAPDIVNSSLTIMVPVADKERFLGMLRDRLEITTEKAEGGLLRAAVPTLNELFIRFEHGYAYFGRTANDLDPKMLPSPRDYFARDPGAVASGVVRFDRIPDELKTFLIGQIELGLAELRKKEGGNESAAQKAVLDTATEKTIAGIKTFLNDARELSARIVIDEKTEDLSLEFALTAKSDSVLARGIAALGERKSLPAAIVAGKEPALHLTVREELPEELKKELATALDSVISEALKDVPGEQEKALLERVFKTFGPTLKAGEIDVAFAIHGPDAKSHYSLIAAIAVKDGKEIEKLVKDLAPFAGDAAEFDFDIEKTGNFTLHSVTVKGAPEEFRQIFGTSKVWLAVSDDVIALSIEPDGQAIKAGLRAKSAPAPVVSLELSAAKLAPLLGQKLKPDELKAVLKDAFGTGSPSGKDTVKLTVTGGEKLSGKASMKGGVVRLLFGLFRLQGP
jgi:hypothetical protein